jgi:hypothetical protein
MTSLEDSLRQMTEFFSPPMVPIERFVLDVGRVYKPRALPPGIVKKKDKLCFMQAFQLAMDHPELEYVEGMAMSPRLPWPSHHAWCVNASDEVIDDTWSDPEKCLYRGVMIDRETVLRECLKSGVYGVLDTGRGPNYALMSALRMRLKSK